MSRTSKRLAYLLRHHPEQFNVTLTPEGFAPVTEVLTALSITDSELRQIVATDSKQRFSFHGDQIRAVQGHSRGVAPAALHVSLDTPSCLTHGTTPEALEHIRVDGLQPMTRNHVHWSTSTTVAHQVASRHGVPVLVQVDTRLARDHGVEFFQAENGVWLSTPVPAHLLTHHGEPLV